MKALICLNGDRPEKRLVAQCASECETVICADGALQYLLDANIFPDLWLGDMDSVSPERLSEAKARGIIPKTYPMQKDYTDGQLAVKEAIASGADELLLLGALGGRSDHLLENMRLLYDACRMGVRAVACSKRERVFLSGDVAEFSEENGRLVSMLPYTDTVTVLRTEGLQYPLTDYTFSRGEFFAISGVSNVLTERRGRYILSGGYGLFVQVKQNE